MISQPTKEQLNVARSWLIKAQSLDRYVSLEEETRQFLNISDENFVLYAVDTDIVMCYTSPWNLALGSSSQSGTAGQKQVSYGEIFPPDIGDFQSASRLTFALAHYIFFELNNSWPIFQLPSHARETTSVFSAAAAHSRLETEKARQNLSLLETWAEIAERRVSEFVSQGAENTDFLGSLGRLNRSEIIQQHDLNEILNQLETFVVNRDKSPNAEMDRYLSLLLEGTLVSTNDATNIANGEPDEVTEILGQLATDGTLSEWITEIGRRDEWVELLSDVHGISETGRRSKRVSKRRSEAILVDANALARLEILNNRLRELNGRVILITGADTILEAADRYDPGFKDKYIRHFHSFVPHLLANAVGSSYAETENTGGTSDFLGFRALSYSEGRTPQKITHSIRSLLSSDPNAFHDIKDEWIRVRDKMILASMTTSDGVGDELSDIFLRDLSNLRQTTSEDGASENLRKSLREFATKIRKELVGERIALAAEFAATGIEFLLALGVSKERNPPDVRFDSYENANSLFNTLKESKNLRDLEPSLRERLDSLSFDTEAKSPGVNDLGYLQFLVFSGVFATAGRWSIAAELAGYAVDIAETKPVTKKGSHVSGREAYYVQASAVRLSARRIEDYTVVRDLLDKARSALEEDKADRPSLKIDRYRFDAEGVALSVGELHHNSMIGDREANSAKVCLETALALLGEVKNTTNNALVELQLYVNILQLISILLQNDAESQTPANLALIVEDCHSAIRSFFSRTEDASIRQTNLIRSYLIFAECYLSSLGKIVSKCRESDLEAFFASIRGSTIYDKDRYKKLSKQCKELCQL